MLAADPMQGLALYLAVGAGQSAARLGVVGALDLRDAAVGILRASGTHYYICVLQAHFLAGSQTHEFLLSLFLEVVALNPNLAAEGNLMGSVGLVLGIVDRGEQLGLAFGIVRDDDLHGVEHSADADGAAVEVLAHGTFQEGNLVEGIERSVAYLTDKAAYALGTVTATAEAANGRHARIVPATDKPLRDKCEQITFAHERIAEVELVELRLARTLIS